MTQRSHRRGRLRRAISLLLGTAVAVSGLAVVAAPGAYATPHDDEWEPPEVPIPYQKAKAGLPYHLTKRYSGWVGAWNSEEDTGKSWPVNTYNPGYVHPTKFEANFANQCVDKTDWDISVNIGGNTVHRYRWIYNNKISEHRYCDNTQLNFPAEGTYPLRMQVLTPGGTVVVDKTSAVRIQDHLIVVIGDSAASGEGAPDQEINLSADDVAEWGGWVDRRCHRSANAASAVAAQALEDADPHSTVTFLSFACSGATIKSFDPAVGSGILGGYDGIEGPGLGEDYPWMWLPPQVEQLRAALALPGGHWPTRTIDRLFISGGINDVHFSDMAADCIIFTDCPNSLGLSQTNPWKLALPSRAADIPGSYVELKDAMAANGIESEQTLVMEYPDPFTNGNKQLCTSILGDALSASAVNNLILWLVSPLGLPILPILLGFLALPPMNEFWPVIGNGVIGSLHWDAEEIKWLSGTGMPALMKGVQDGAKAAGFTYVGGIGAKFKGHGYCASDHWLRRAPESSKTQGPWNLLSKPIGVWDWGFNIHALTKGTIHPNPKGYREIAKVLKPYLDTLINKGPIAKNDYFDTNKNTPINNPFAGVLANDSDPNGDELIVSLQTPPSKGTVQLSSAGAFTYTPKQDFVGKDQFVYRVTDGSKTAQATVTIQVWDPNPPKREINWDWEFPLGDGTVYVPVGQTIDVPICDRCGTGFPVRPVLRRQPRFGTVVLVQVREGVVARFTSTVGVHGAMPDTFVVDIRKRRGNARVATTAVTVIVDGRLVS